MSRPLILVTNDDGFDAPGIRALAESAEALGEVAVVAPDGNRSGVGRGITLGRALRARPTGHLRWKVDGTPVDCVYLALHELLPRRPALVFSGVNRGPNLADDVGYSGTVAGAMEGALVGVPSVAVSLVDWHPRDYTPAATFAAEVGRWVLDNGLPRRVVLNVNVPPGEGPVQAYRWCTGGERDYGHTVTTRVDPRGLPYYWLGTDRLSHQPVVGSDCEAIEQGLASITPLTLDLTDHRTLGDLREVKIGDFERR